MKIRSTKNILLFIWVAVGLVFIAWNLISYQAHNLDTDTFQTIDAVAVSETDDVIAFKSNVANPTILLFFPGAMVDPRAYAPLSRRIAQTGYSVYIIKMPWRMATFGYKKIGTLFNLADTTKHYVLCGHSQGGKMAAQYVYENPNTISGLILLGTSHPRDFDLSTIKIPVMKLYASNDGLADVNEVMQNKAKLPTNTKYVLIEGGNHAQFGYYGSQLGDNKATIDRTKQQEIIYQFIISFLKGYN